MRLLPECPAGEVVEPPDARFTPYAYGILVEVFIGAEQYRPLCLGSRYLLFESRSEAIRTARETRQLLLENCPSFVR